MAVSNGTGQGGKSFQDRQLAATVRSLALEEIKKVLEKGNTKGNDLYKPVLLKLAGTVLPRLNEHSGEDGKPIEIQIAKEISDKNEADTSTSENSD